MAAIVAPTWTEVQTIDELTLTAISIIRGEMQGDEFVWDAEWYDEKTDMVYYGQWKSTLDAERKKNSGEVIS